MSYNLCIYCNALLDQKLCRHLSLHEMIREIFINSCKWKLVTPTCSRATLRISHLFMCYSHITGLFSTYFGPDVLRPLFHVAALVDSYCHTSILS